MAAMVKTKLSRKKIDFNSTVKSVNNSIFSTYNTRTFIYRWKVESKADRTVLVVNRLEIFSKEGGVSTID